MTNCMPILEVLVGHNVSETIPPINWHFIDWERATRIVKMLQRRIVKAVKARKWKKVRDLQRLLNNSYSAKVLAIIIKAPILSIKDRGFCVDRNKNSCFAVPASAKAIALSRPSKSFYLPK